MSIYITRNAAIAREWAFLAAAEAAEADEAAYVAQAAEAAAREAAYEAFYALTPEEQQRAMDEAYGLYDTIYDY